MKTKNQKPKNNVPTCRVCGCTDDHACEGGCYWAESDLCSQCKDILNALGRLKGFIHYQRSHWKKIRRGFRHPQEIINGWIESCDLAKEDLKTVRRFIDGK